MPSLPAAKSRSDRGSPHPGDLKLTALVLALVAVPYLVPNGIAWSPGRYLLESVSALPLIWRRRHPILVAMTSGPITLVAAATVHPAQPFPYAVLICEYTFGAELAGRTRRCMSVLFLLGNFVAELLHGQSGNGYDFVTTFVISVTAILLGMLAQTQRAYAAALEERASTLEGNRAAELERAAATERARIARDMHDVVGHAVALMVVQAEAGPLLVRDRPEKAEAAFDAISEAGRDAMAQLRRLLGVLGQDDPAARAPQPTVASIDGLVEQVRNSGLAVILTSNGTPIPLPADTEAAAYRVVQEALTNTMKHAAATTVDVHLDWSADALGITVVDDGRGLASAGADGLDPSGDGLAGPGSGGHGLVGLRERLAAVGGSLTCRSPLGSAGFALCAHLPSDG